jgi:hypothetical protein
MGIFVYYAIIEIKNEGSIYNMKKISITIVSLLFLVIGGIQLNNSLIQKQIHSIEKYLNDENLTNNQVSFEDGAFYIEIKVNNFDDEIVLNQTKKSEITNTIASNILYFNSAIVLSFTM